MADAGRYRLYASYACPWCSRVILVRALKGLERAVPMTNLVPERDAEGWRFSAGEPDPVLGAEHLSELYRADDPGFSGRATAPILWDTEAAKIVSGDSGELMRIFNNDFNELAENPGLDLSPAALREEIDAVNARVQEQLNVGVYRTGTATTQREYEAGVHEVFAALEHFEQLLGRQRWLVGERLTEADLRLVTTLWRFDAVYVGLFKCNLRTLAELPNLQAYAREIFQLPGVAGTVRIDEIKRHYYGDRSLNPTGVVPLGPELDWTTPHGRG